MNELRLLIAEWLLGRALDIMPKSEEQIELALFLRDYMKRRIEAQSDIPR